MTALLLCSHYLNQPENLCNEVRKFTQLQYTDKFGLKETPSLCKLLSKQQHNSNSKSDNIYRMW